MISIWTLQEKWKKKTTVERESGDDTNWNWCAWYSHKRIDKGTGGLENKRASGDYPNNSIIKIG